MLEDLFSIETVKMDSKPTRNNKDMELPLIFPDHHLLGTTTKGTLAPGKAGGTGLLLYMSI